MAEACMCAVNGKHAAAALLRLRVGSASAVLLREQHTAAHEVTSSRRNKTYA
jgi:hypothetical protein